MSRQNEITNKAIKLIAEIPKIVLEYQEANVEAIEKTNQYNHLAVGLTERERELLIILIQTSYTNGIDDGLALSRRIDGVIE